MVLLLDGLGMFGDDEACVDEDLDRSGNELASLLISISSSSISLPQSSFIRPSDRGRSCSMS